MKIAYIGTPELSAGLLKKIIENQKELGVEISVVITQPDMPVGRKQIMTPAPVKEMALQNGLLISHDLSVLKEKNVELALLFAFGKIIPQNILDIPVHGFWNIHPSLLPAYRGASPITFAMFLGEKESGVTLMQMDADLDHGPIIGQKKFDIPLSAKRSDIEKEVIEISYELFSSKIKELNESRNVGVVQQNHSQATFTRPLEKNDGYIKRDLLLKAISGEEIMREDLPQLIKNFYDMNTLDCPDNKYSSAEVLWNLYRSLHGWPGVWTTILHENKEKRLKIISAEFIGNTFKPTEVQLEGKNIVSFETFLRAYSLN